MYEVNQKILKMTLEEFKKYEVPDGWKLLHVGGHEKYGWPGSLDVYFEMSVTIQKEKRDGI